MGWRLLKRRTTPATTGGAGPARAPGAVPGGPGKGAAPAPPGPPAAAPRTRGERITEAAGAAAANRTAGRVTDQVAGRIGGTAAGKTGDSGTGTGGATAGGMARGVSGSGPGSGPGRGGAPGMYEGFYGLTERPFTTVPDPQFLYWSESHQMAFAVLYYGVMTRAPITVITGAIGAGKTTLLRRLLAEMPEDLTVGLVSNMKEGRGELLQWVMMSLDQPFEPDEPYVTLFRRFQDFVIDAYARGRRVVLIVDEAQNLGAAALEELRMLSNINADKDELLQLILVGQPQLRDLLNDPDLAQFAQRVSADFHLEPLSREDTVSYIRRRLEIAGAGWRIFPDEVSRAICDATGGVPRLVNILCDLCLVYGFADGRREIGADLLAEILASTRRRGIFGQFDAGAAMATARRAQQRAGGTG